ncbi:MAG: FCD domain-containing protein [Geminicoccaceae bacterium]|nr:FCD domain-containing protein [Geminicoccaceae bacterium]
MREQASGMRANLDIPDLVMQHDMELHKILARASRNPVFVLLVGAFEGIIARTWPIGWRARTTPEAREAMIANHEKIAEAVVQGEPERAMQAMAAHFDETVRALISAGLV